MHNKYLFPVEEKEVVDKTQDKSQDNSRLKRAIGSNDKSWKAIEPEQFENMV